VPRRRPLTQPDLSAGQWIYQVTKWSTPGRIPDGDAGVIGNPICPYDKLDSLPRDPARLDADFVSQDPVKTDNKSVVAFGQISSMLFGMVLPPWLEAEMFHALALIPMVAVKDHVTDIAGRAGVAFVLPETGQSEKQEIILDASDYHLLAQAHWGNPRTTSPNIETAILKEYPVAELGSTQQAVAPPSAAEQAAEKIDSYEEYEYYPTKINSVPPASGCTGRCAPAQGRRRSGRPPTTPPRLGMCTASLWCASAPRPARRRSSG
jgi:hypothetical protein